MDEQVSIVRKEPAQEVEVTSEFGGNSANRSSRRRRNASGPGSPGEKALLKKNPLWLVSPKAKIPVFNSCLYSLDEVVATPSFNVSVIEGACDQDFKFFDAINKSKYVGSIDGALACLGLFAISTGIYVIEYCKLREIERNSNYFYFIRLFKTCNAEKIKNTMGKIDQENDDTNAHITYEYLRAAAYFYPPDISKIACWRSRFFSSGKERKQLKALNHFLQKNSKEKTLKKLHRIITEKVCLLLNKEANLLNFQTKSSKGNLTIGLTNNYEIKFFNHVKPLVATNIRETKEKNAKQNRNFFPSILAALGQASFIYWILMFIFCFIPIAPVVTTAAISVIPLVIALGVALPLLLYFKIKSTNRAYNTIKSMSEVDIQIEHTHMLEKKLVALNKQNIFLSFLRNKDVDSTVEFKNSPLLKDLNTILKKRRFSKYHAICTGFLDGCFLPLFVGWVFLDGTKVILTYILCPSTVALTSFTPIGLIATAIIAGVILLIGISYGIYSAYKAYQAHEARFEDLEAKIKALEHDLQNELILNKSLRDYDRLLRRFSDEQPIWTIVKKAVNRLLIIIKRLGTGSLVFRLVIWGPITAVVAASTAVIPTFFPIILIVGTVIGALVLASWYLYAYNLESKTTQAGRIVEYLVQSEQLSCMNKELPIFSTEECLNIHESNSEKASVPAENLAEFEKDKSITPEFSQENISAAAVDTKVGAMTTQTEINLPRNNSSSSLHGLFKNNLQVVENSNENIVVGLKHG
ncbi:MAG: hypothetical protein WA659_02845 [Candidatus Aquirickettsiella sp.]